MKRRSCGRDEPRARAGGCDIYWAKPRRGGRRQGAPGHSAAPPGLEWEMKREPWANARG